MTWQASSTCSFVSLRLSAMSSLVLNFLCIIWITNNVGNENDVVIVCESGYFLGLSVSCTPRQYQKSALVPFDLTILAGATAILKCEQVIPVPAWPFVSFSELPGHMDQRVDVKCENNYSLFWRSSLFCSWWGNVLHRVLVGHSLTNERILPVKLSSLQISLGLSQHSSYLSYKITCSRL